MKNTGKKIWFVSNSWPRSIRTIWRSENDTLHVCLNGHYVPLGYVKAKSTDWFIDEAKSFA